MMRVRIGEFVAAVCVVAWGVARVWAAPGAIGGACQFFCVWGLEVGGDAAQGEVGAAGVVPVDPGGGFVRRLPIGLVPQ